MAAISANKWAALLACEAAISDAGLAVMAMEVLVLIYWLRMGKIWCWSYLYIRGSSIGLQLERSWGESLNCCYMQELGLVYWERVELKQGIKVQIGRVSWHQGIKPKFKLEITWLRVCLALKEIFGLLRDCLVNKLSGFWVISASCLTKAGERSHQNVLGPQTVFIFFFKPNKKVEIWHKTAAAIDFLERFHSNKQALRKCLWPQLQFYIFFMLETYIRSSWLCLASNVAIGFILLALCHIWLLGALYGGSIWYSAIYWCGVSYVTL